MSFRKLNSIDLNANVYTGLFTGRAGFDTTANIHICNRNTTVARVSIAYVSSTNAADMRPEDHIYFDYLVSANDTMNLRGVAVEQNCTIVVRSDSTNVGAIAYGVEEEIV